MKTIIEHQNNIKQNGNEHHTNGEHITDKTQANTKGLEPRKLDVEMSNEDFDKLVNAAKNDIIDTFVQDYQNLNIQLTYLDVIALGATKAINTNQKLSTLIYATDHESPDIVVTLDRNGENAILAALTLKDDGAISTLSSYIFGLTSEQKIAAKFIMSKELIDKIASAIHDYWSEVYHPTVLIDELIRPLYMEDSVNKLISEIGQDWLDNCYYI